jgi:phytoene dehydrogenase-like protein
MRVAIVGGGPGGLLTSYLLQGRTSTPIRIKLFEASDRLGGKLFTAQFDSAPVQYEAGTAELYGYAHIGCDPLFNLIQGLGLGTINLYSKTVVIDGEILDGPESIGRHLGTKALYAIQNFHSEARRRVRPLDYYNSGWPDENRNPLVRKSFRSLLAKVPSLAARHYLEVAVHSDLATDPARTHALYGLHNVLLEHDDYVRLYAIEGGMESLTGAVTKKLTAHLALSHRLIIS